MTTPITAQSLHAARAAGQRLTMLTAYDAGFARVLDDNDIEMILVGDSLGMLVQGHASTLPVTLEQMVYHTACVARVVRRALVISDLPFQSDATADKALAAATALLQAGAGMVKLEGAGHKLASIRYLVERQIPVCAHLGLTPQSVLAFGGFKVQGREVEAATRLKVEALQVAEAGAQLLVLEGIPSALAAEITDASPIPTIGIGAGPDCDGQVLTLHDMLGLEGGISRPRFVKDFLAEGGSIAGAVRAYAAAVREGRFPAAEHSYH